MSSTVQNRWLKSKPAGLWMTLLSYWIVSSHLGTETAYRRKCSTWIIWICFLLSVLAGWRKVVQSVCKHGVYDHGPLRQCSGTWGLMQTACSWTYLNKIRKTYTFIRPLIPPESPYQSQKVVVSFSLSWISSKRWWERDARDTWLKLDTKWPQRCKWSPWDTKWQKTDNDCRRQVCRGFLSVCHSSVAEGVDLSHVCCLIICPWL